MDPMTIAALASILGTVMQTSTGVKQQGEAANAAQMAGAQEGGAGSSALQGVNTGINAMNMIGSFMPQPPSIPGASGGGYNPFEQLKSMGIDQLMRYAQGRGGF